MLYTDSKKEVRECGKHNPRSQTFGIRAAAIYLREIGCPVAIRWVPGLNGIPSTHGSTGNSLLQTGIVGGPVWTYLSVEQRGKTQDDKESTRTQR